MRRDRGAKHLQMFVAFGLIEQGMRGVELHVILPARNQVPMPRPPAQATGPDVRHSRGITESWQRGSLCGPCPGRTARTSSEWRNGSRTARRPRNRHEGHGHRRSLGRMDRLRETWHSIPPRTNPRTTAKHFRACHANRYSAQNLTTIPPSQIRRASANVYILDKSQHCDGWNTIYADAWWEPVYPVAGVVPNRNLPEEEREYAQY